MPIDDLYRDVILDHYRNPRRRGRLNHDAIHADGQNPSCGDEFGVDVVVGGGIITDIATQGQGCSISQASGSMMADAVVGLTIDEVRDLASSFKRMMSIVEGDNPVDPERPGAVLGDLEALQGVRQFPVRIRCADLAWVALEDAIDQWETAAAVGA
ncbi:MAG: SUF system NifU family Fe-S cluster assembly protein [Acidimicrobiia bacterium]|nr:SUF system NifU family Fe-S cluster assembly protein [Acidimicrobiia bacterium]